MDNEIFYFGFIVGAFIVSMIWILFVKSFFEEKQGKLKSRIVFEFDTKTFKKIQTIIQKNNIDFKEYLTTLIFEDITKKYTKKL